MRTRGYWTSAAILALIGAALYLFTTSPDTAPGPVRASVPSVSRHELHDLPSSDPQVERRSLRKQWRFHVVDTTGRPIVAARVYRTGPEVRVVDGKTCLVGETGDDGVMTVDALDAPDAAYLASSLEVGVDVFIRIGDRDWRCVLHGRPPTVLRFRTEDGAVVESPCTVFASLQPWGAAFGEHWARVEAGSELVPNLSQPKTAVFVARARDGEARLHGLPPGQYCVEVACNDYVAVRGVTEERAVAVPGGPYECVMLPVLVGVVGVPAPDEIVSRAHRLPVGLSAFPPFGFRAMRRCVEDLERRFPANRFIVVVGVDERSTSSQAPTVRVTGYSRVRGLWHHDLLLRPVRDLVVETSAAPAGEERTVEVVLTLRDHKGRAVEGCFIRLEEEESQRGVDPAGERVTGWTTPVPDGRAVEQVSIGREVEVSHRAVKLGYELVAGRPTRVPKGRYGVRSTCRPLQQSLEHVRVDVVTGGPLTLDVKAPLVPCRVRIDSGADDLPAVRVRVANEGGGVWAYGCDGEHPIAWLPEGRVEVSVSAPGFEPSSRWFDLGLGSDGRPVELRCELRRQGP